MLHFIQGIDIIARAIVTPDSITISHGAYLMSKLRTFGVIQHIRSAIFDVSRNVANQLYRDNNTLFVIFHPSILTFETTDAIRALRSRGNRQNDANYRRENKPGYFIGVDNEKLSQREAQQRLGGTGVLTQGALRALMTEYIQGGRQPVSREIREQMVTVRT